MKTNENKYICLDSLVAELNILVTNFLLDNKPCQNQTNDIVNQLSKICRHDELGFFPAQQRVYISMLKVWNLMAFSNSNHNNAIENSAAH